MCEVGVQTELPKSDHASAYLAFSLAAGRLDGARRSQRSQHRPGGDLHDLQFLGNKQWCAYYEEQSHHRLYGYRPVTLSGMSGIS